MESLELVLLAGSWPKQRIEREVISVEAGQESKVDQAVDELQARRCPVLRERYPRHKDNHHEKSGNQRDPREQAEKQKQAEERFDPRQRRCKKGNGSLRDEDGGRQGLGEVRKESFVIPEQTAHAVETNVQPKHETKEPIRDAVVRLSVVHLDSPPAAFAEEICAAFFIVVRVREPGADDSGTDERARRYSWRRAMARSKKGCEPGAQEMGKETVPNFSGAE
jgi:hypothetical protein